MSNQHRGIAFNNSEALSTRVLISGVTTTTEDEPNYAPGSVVPTTHDLREPTWNELQPFSATVDTPDAGLIELIGSTLRLAGALTATSPHPIKPVRNAPGMLTATMNEGTGLLEAIHIDHQEGYAIINRHKSERRIGCNFGPGIRHLLIASIDAFDLAALYGDEAGDPNQYIPTTTDFRRYVAESIRGEHEPVQTLWLRVERGEAYVAPTAIIGHDATTHLADQESASRFKRDTWPRGYFGSII